MLPELLLGDERGSSPIFKNILEFVGDPFDFRRLSQTCRPLSTYLSPDNEDAWKLSSHYQEFKDDDRVTRAFDKAMNARVLEKIRAEQASSEDIFLTEVERDEDPKDFTGMREFLVPVISRVSFSVSGTILFGPDFGKNLFWMIEANMIDYLQKAAKYCAYRAEEDIYPILVTKDLEFVFNRLPNHKGNLFGGRFAPKIGIGLLLEVLYNTGLVPKYERVVRRWAYRAGIVMYSDAAAVYIWAVTLYMTFALLELESLLSKGDHFPLQHPANIHMAKFQFSKDLKYLLPGILPHAAQRLGLAITKVLSTDAILSDDDALFRDYFPKYYNSLTEDEKKAYDDSVDKANRSVTVFFAETNTDGDVMMESEVDLVEDDDEDDYSMYSDSDDDDEEMHVSQQD
jgi:hypothetical protein